MKRGRALLLAAGALLALAGLFALWRGLAAGEGTDAGLERTVSRGTVGGAPTDADAALPAARPGRAEEDEARAEPRRVPGSQDALPAAPALASEPAPAAPAVPVGDVRGFLRSERGAWDATGLPTDAIVLDLVSVDDPRVTRRARIEPTEGDAAELAFAFLEVPHGEYELTLSTLGAHRWHPSAMFVSPPAENLEFLRYDRDETGPVAFRVLDAESGEEISDYEVFRLEQQVSLASGTLLHTGPLELDDVPVHARFRWSLVAEGYAAAFGDERSFRLEDGARVAPVRLRRGFAARFVVLGRDPFMRPLAGAGVTADGAFLGTTDADGGLHVALASRPETLEVSFRDWVLTNAPFEARQGLSIARRGFVVPLILAPPE